MQVRDFASLRAERQSRRRACALRFEKVSVADAFIQAEPDEVVRRGSYAGGRFGYLGPFARRAPIL